MTSKALPFDKARCSGRYSLGEGTAGDPGNWCPQRETCARYMSFVKWDREAGLTNYRGVLVVMASRECMNKIEAEPHP